MEIFWAPRPRKRMPYKPLQDKMDEYGWIITGFPGGAIYTVGLIDKWHHPEIAVHGLSYDQAAGIIRSAVERIEHGVKFNTVDSFNDILKGFPVRFLRVAESNHHDWFGVASRYHGHFAMLQMLWPDTEGNFPGDPNYELRFSGQLRFDVRRPEYGDQEGDRP